MAMYYVYIYRKTIVSIMRITQSVLEKRGKIVMELFYIIGDLYCDYSNNLYDKIIINNTQYSDVVISRTESVDNVLDQIYGNKHCNLNNNIAKNSNTQIYTNVVKNDEDKNCIQYIILAFIYSDIPSDSNKNKNDDSNIYDQVVIVNTNTDKIFNKNEHQKISIVGADSVENALDQIYSDQNSILKYKQTIIQKPLFIQIF